MIEVIIIAVEVMAGQGMSEPLGCVGIVLYLTMGVVVPQVYTYVKIHAAGQLVTIYELYLWYTPQNKSKRKSKTKKKKESKEKNPPRVISFKHVSRNVTSFIKPSWASCFRWQWLANSSLGLPRSCMFWDQPTLTSLTTFAPLPPHFLFLTPLQPHWYFSSRKHQALFWPRSLAFTLHSEWNILLPEPIPKTAANSPFQSQRKCHLLCLTALVAFSSHHPSLPYCPTYPLQFYVLHLFSKTILFAYLLFISLSSTKMHALWDSGQGHSLKVTAISPSV